MFRDDDFGLRELRRIALNFPEAFEKVSSGRPVLCAPKIFAMYGGNAKTGSEYTPYPHSMLVKVDESERRALERTSGSSTVAYMGPSGWLGLDLTAAKVDWDEVRELVDASYRIVAPKKLVKQLDEG
jgi:predicted DNA-binding protein (MmcQ/YjbR family)